MESFEFEQKVLFRADLFFLCEIRIIGFNAQGGASGQNLGHLRFFIFCLAAKAARLYSIFMSISDTQCSFSCADFKGKSLPSLNDYWGKHCALITSGQV